MPTAEAETTAEQPLYTLDNVSRRYQLGKTEVRALHAVTVNIKQGEVLSIEGPSGSGKSTLLLLLGVLDVPTGGSIMFDGKDLTRANDAELTGMRSTTIGYVFQQFNLIPTLTAIENVEIAMIPRKVPKVERHQRAGALLEQVGLGHRFDHLPSRLSGGEQQRVAIARALANKPRVIIADEPTGNLDSKSAEEIIKLLVGLQETEGVTLIIATHDSEVSAKAHRILKMRDGSILTDTADPTSTKAKSKAKD